MKYNKDCMYLRQKVVEKPIAGKPNITFKTKYVCGFSKDYMKTNGCPPSTLCKGFRPSNIDLVHYTD